MASDFDSASPTSEAPSSPVSRSSSPDFAPMSRSSSPDPDTAEMDLSATQADLGNEESDVEDEESGDEDEESGIKGGECFDGEEYDLERDESANGDESVDGDEYNTGMGGYLKYKQPNLENEGYSEDEKSDFGDEEYDENEVVYLTNDVYVKNDESSFDHFHFDSDVGGSYSDEIPNGSYSNNVKFPQPSPATVFWSKLHPNGIRVLPPEIRRMIFCDCFDESDIVVEEWDIFESPALFDAMNGYDNALLVEVATAFLMKKTIVITAQCKEFVKEGEIIGTTFHYDWWLPKKFPPLIRKLRIRMSLESIDINHDLEEEEEEEDEILEKLDYTSEYRIFVPEELENVNELTLDYTELYNSVEFVESHFVQFLDFKRLTKLSVVLAMPHNRSRVPEGTYSVLRHRSNVFYFENILLPIAQAALKVSPKLTSVRSSTLDTEEHKCLSTKLTKLDHFCPHEFGWEPGDDRTAFNKREVAWFWVAERGKLLKWDEEAAQKQREGLKDVISLVDCEEHKYSWERNMG